MTGMERIQLTPPGSLGLSSREAMSRLEQCLRRYRLDSALARIGQWGSILSNEDLTAQQSMHWQQLWIPQVPLHQLAYMAKRLIQVSNDHRAVELTDPEYLTCAGLYNDAQGIDLPEEPDIVDIDRFMIRLAYQQFPLQAAP